MHVGVQYLLRILCSFLWGIYRSGITVSYGNSIFIFLETIILCSTVAVPLHILKHQRTAVPAPSHLCQHLLFLFCYYRHPSVGEVMFGFWFAFPQWILILSIFSYAFVPCIPLWSNGYLNSLLTFKLSCLLFLNYRSFLFTLLALDIDSF